MLEKKVIFDESNGGDFCSPRPFLSFLEELESKEIAKLADETSRRVGNMSINKKIYSIDGAVLIYDYHSSCVLLDSYGSVYTLTLTGETEAIAKAEEIIRYPIKTKKQ